MAVKTRIKPSEYHDSVSLMVLARDLARLPGVVDASVVMATEANKALLKSAGLLTPQVEASKPDDLIIAVSGSEEILEQALDEAERTLRRKTVSKENGEYHPKTLRSAVKANLSANLAVISVAGRYAAGEAWEALRSGLHVLLFSDNVSIQDEIALKQYASEHGLLMMGPGAGTVILNGTALGFGNALPPGPVGIVSAAGTGLQEVSTLIAKYGSGITQGIGTGGRDLKEEVGGIMMLQGLEALQADPDTEVIVLISKPPAAGVARRVLEQVGLSDKPTVICFLGGDPEVANTVPNAIPVSTLQEAAVIAASIAQQQESPQTRLASFLNEENLHLAENALKLRSELSQTQKYLRGLFSGGTLCYEAQLIWRNTLPGRVLSNAPLDPADLLTDSTCSLGHSALDLGEEEFTVGRPHPMIDQSLRIRRLLQEAHDPEVAVILMDVVLGYGAHPDPTAELGPAIVQARQIAEQAGRHLVVVASVTGSEADPQCLSRQAEALERAGVVVCESNAAAARLAVGVVCG